jgi:hypothetical protein
MPSALFDKAQGVINSWFKSSARSAVSWTYDVEVFRLPAHHRTLQMINKAIYDRSLPSMRPPFDRAVQVNELKRSTREPAHFSK